MSIYSKLNAARNEFHAMTLKKTGRNNFAGYDYFELGDFLIPALKAMSNAGLCAFITFTKETATMRIVDTEKPDDHIIIECPMSECALKGCHPVQNLGAVQTYTRRYLWVAALEIVEHDALNLTQKKAPEGVYVSDSRMKVCSEVAQAMREKFDNGDIVGAYEEYIGIEDNEEKTALWAMLKPNSALRSAIKKHGETLKGQ